MAVIDLNVGVDWNRDGHICLQTGASDNLNIVKLYYPNVLDYSTWDYGSLGTGASVSITNNTEYPDLYHGLNTFNIVAGTANFGGFRVFTDGTNFPITHDAGDVDYYFRFWFKSDGGHTPTDKLNIRIRKDNDSVNVTSEATNDLSTNWQAHTITGTLTGGDAPTDLTLRITKNNYATNFTFYITGIMFFLDPVGGFSVPTNFNTGDSMDAYDNITSDIDNTIFWSGGVESYEPIESEHRAFFALNNTFPTRKYSLENSNSPLYGVYPNDLLFRIVDIGAATNNSLYTGNIDVWTPSIGMKADQIVSVETTNSFSRKKDLLIIPDLYEATTTGAVIADLLQKVDADIGTSQIATGNRVINYFGDNADDEFPVPQQAQGLVSYIQHLVMAELGKMYSDGLARQVFLNDEWIINNTSSATYTDEFTAYEYHPYGAMLINQVIVKCYPRVEDSSTTLWGLDKDARIKAGQKRTLRGKYTDANNSEVGGKTVVTPSGSDYVVTGATPAVTINKGGQYFEVEFDNSDGTQDAVISTYDVKGLPVSTFNGAQIVAQDDASIADYGLASITLDLKAVDDLDVAYDIALRILARFNTPRSEFRYIQLSKKYNSADSISLMATVFGTRITVVEAQTLHNADYLIVGWMHEIIMSEYRHNIGLVLESAIDSIEIVYDDDFSDGLGSNLTKSDAGSRFTIGSGTAVLATGTGNSYLYYDDVTIENGTAFLVRYKYTAASNNYIGMDTTFNDTTGHKASNQVVTDADNAALPRVWSTDTMNFIVVQVYGGYQLHFFDNQLVYIRSDGNTTPQDLFFASQSPATDAGTIYHMRVANFIGKWATTDYSWADYYLATVTSSLTHIPKSADNVNYVKWTPDTNGEFNIYTRRKNDVDCIRIRFDQSAGGSITVYANGSSIATQAVTFTASTEYTLQWILWGNSIAVYVDDNREISTTSTHNQTIKQIKVTRESSDTASEYISLKYYQSDDISLRLMQENLS